MKEKIILFVVGLLVGAVISTGAFYIYTTSTNSCNCSNQNTKMPSGQNGQPPSMPSGSNSQNGEPPAKPGESNSNNSQSNS